MSLPRYPEYKKSVMGWFGEVPRNWTLQRLKKTASLITQKATNRTYPVALENIEGWSGRFICTDGEFEGDGIAFLAGDILFGKLRPYLAKAYLAKTPGEAVGDFHVLRPTRKIDGRFLQYQILNRAFIDIVDGSTFGSKMPRANWEVLGNMPVLVPKMEEQLAITIFLDREIAKIDTLIAEQEKLITLLAEKRQATISHTITRGLNPEAPMKDSGVAWLGVIPNHWQLTRIKFVTHSIEQGWSPQCENFPVESSDEWGVLKVGCVNGGQFRPSENKKLPPELEAQTTYALKQGDLLVSRANTRELVGSAAVVPTDYDNLLLCDKLYRLRLHEGMGSPTFVAAYLGTPIARSQIELDATGASSSMVNIGQAVIMDMFIPLPSLDEQRRITDFIESESLRFDALMNEAMKAIALLTERRSALISAAVTGQIDVRQLVEPSTTT